jgi:hypothetical protein
VAASSLLSLLLGVEHEDHYTMVCDDNEKYPFDRDVHHFTLPSCASSEDVLLDGQQEHYSRITFHYRSQTKKPRSGYHQTAQLPIAIQTLPKQSCQSSPPCLGVVESKKQELQQLNSMLC